MYFSSQMIHQLTIRITAILILLGLGVISITTCISAINSDVTCTDAQCADNKLPVQEQGDNETDRCCGHAGHCGHASAWLIGSPAQFMPSLSNERMAYDDLVASDGPVFGVDRPPQLV
jgi:hypothetical protein